MRLRSAGALGLFFVLPAWSATLGADGSALPLGEAPVAGHFQAQPDLVVSVDWLAEHRSDPDLVLLHVGPEDEYRAGHIPGAHYISLRDISRPAASGSEDLALEMPSPEVLRAAFESRGVSDDSRVIVYFEGDWVTPATRVVFTLDYLGLGGQTSLLNGGQPAWTAAGHELSTDDPPSAQGSITPRPVRSELIVGADDAASAGEPGGTVLVDARDLHFYDGTRPTQGGREGHIPGAVSIPFPSAVDDALHWSTEKLASAFASVGIEDGDPIVVYCHIGQQATTILFGARLLGHPVQLYDGSFQDWAKQDRPVEAGGGPGG